MRFESRELPDDGDLAPLLRQVAMQGFVDRGDAGDFSPFDWVARLYEGYPDWRDRVDSTRTDGRSLLGSIIDTAAMMGKTVRPSVALARELAAIDRPEDGWPSSLRLALPSDVKGFLPRVISVLKQLDSEQLYDFVNGMVADGPPWDGRRARPGTDGTRTRIEIEEQGLK